MGDLQRTLVRHVSGGLDAESVKSSCSGNEDKQYRRIVANSTPSNDSGKHTPADNFNEAKKLHHHRFKRPSDKHLLGSGSFGLVEKVHYLHANRTICLARKHIPYQRRRTIQLMREEADVMEKLDHEHIVKLVGTYCIKPNELFILLWPVAVCNLDELFNDLDALNSGHEDQDILARLEALELSPRRNGSNAIANYLQQLVGCIARAVAYCHEADIRHLDLKPSNILLNPGRVYLADFGIARDVHDRDHTNTLGPQGTPKWRAPEILNQDDEWSMKAADVYSLGLILLNIATVLYGAELADFDSVIGELSPRRRAEKLDGYTSKLEGMALATQAVSDPNAPTFAPRHILGLTSRMVSMEPSRRPVATQVDADLVELGGLDQVYHSACCKRSRRHVLDRMSHRLKLVTDDRNRLLSDNRTMGKRLDELERKDETYESRIQKERNSLAERNQKIDHLQAQLEHEKTERKKAEALVEELRRAGAGQGGARARFAHNRQGISSRPAPAPPLETERPVSRTAACVRDTSSNDLTMRAARRTHPPPTTSTSPLPLSQPQPQRKASINAAAQPTSLFQTAASASRSSTIPAPGAGPVRKVSMSRAVGTSPGASAQSLLPVSVSHTPSPSPAPDSPGFGYPLRTRLSGSKLPQPVHPSGTPILHPATPSTRSGTPIRLPRDPSDSTDSTQFSMSSSIFSSSRLSGHSQYSHHSGAETSVAGTPALEQSPFGNDKKTTGDGRGKYDKTEHAIPTTTSPENTFTSSSDPFNVGLGIDDVMAAKTQVQVQVRPVQRRESVLSDRSVATSYSDAVSRSKAVSVASPVLSASGGDVSSPLSSPRATYAVLDGHTGRVRPPSLPTGKSWADIAAKPVARVQVRQVPQAGLVQGRTRG